MRYKYNNIQYCYMLYPTLSDKAFVIIQYIIVEIEGVAFKPSVEFLNQYFEQEEDAYLAIADRGKVSVRYFILPSTTIFRQSTLDVQY